MKADSTPAAESFYAPHQKIYAREVSGRFARLRVFAMLALLGVFYGLPWLNWGGRQAVLFDLPARKFFIFGLTFFPQDFFLLTWLLVIAALSLFFFTALAGRLWCGYACPQTVWTEAFIWMERLIEGGRAKQMKLDRSPWGLRKAALKTAKYSVWIGFAAFTGFSFVGFFAPIRSLSGDTLGGTLGGWEEFWIIFYGFATLGNAGFLREQVCKYMCPYARFQSAMFDRNTLVISYDARRGEPRGAHRRGQSPRELGLGDCVDCTRCVQVCPTGIDIRKGLQYECIACAACIDTCDEVMDQLKLPRGLVKYSTQSDLDGKPTRILRPRILVYATALLLLVAGFAYAVAHRHLVDLDVMRDRVALYRELDDGRLENVYTVRIINKDQRPHRFVMSVMNLPDGSIDSDAPTQDVQAEEVKTVVVRVRVPGMTEHGGHDFSIVARAADQPEVAAASRARFFFGP
jgi:cytochrome c oxidase accessory protein FixG